MATLNMSDEALDVLKRSVITSQSVTLPPEQLDRKLYMEVNKLLEALGGKWNRKAKAHLFNDDPMLKLGEVLGASGKIEYVDAKKDFAFFETPAELAQKMVQLANLVPGDLVLEPSIGMGGIAKFVPNYCKVVGYDVNPDFVKKMSILFRGIVDCVDFLSVDPEHDATYDAVIMNPPFNKGQDVTHVTHAWEFLKPGGTLVALTSRSWLHNSQKKFVAFKKLVEQYATYQEEIPEGTFKEAGTNIGTILIVLKKNS